jgi:hypothetical protein
MANSFAKDKMHTLFGEVAETTSMNMTLSKDVDVYDMSDASDMGRTTESDGSGADIEYIPQEYRFTVQDGHVSSGSDFQDLTDRMIPVRRNKAKRILTQISTKDLRDPARMERVKKGMAKDIAYAVDTTLYQEMINKSSIVETSTTAFDYNLAIDAETTMLNRGLSSFDKKLFLSNTHYRKVAKELANASRDIRVDDALTRAKIPDLATFDTMRSDYLLTLAANATTGLAINGDQSHTVSTYDSAGNFYLDNRQMTLAITGATAGKLPVGTKFTIAGVNALNEATRTDNGELQTFTVLSATTGSAVVSPAIVTSGPYANCSAEAADTAAVTILNIASSAPSLFYTPESTVIVPGRLPVAPEANNVNVVEAITDNGLPMRMTYEWDFHNEVLNCKTLIYFDTAVIHPEMLGCILDNQA